jgi:hypothetical protein
MKTVDVFTLFMDLSIRSIVRVISSSSFFVFIMQRKEEKKHIFLLILLFYRPAGLYLYTNSYIIRILANRQVVIEKKKERKRKKCIQQQTFVRVFVCVCWNFKKRIQGPLFV